MKSDSTRWEKHTFADSPDMQLYLYCRREETSRTRPNFCGLGQASMLNIGFRVYTGHVVECPANAARNEAVGTSRDRTSGFHWPLEQPRWAPVETCPWRPSQHGVIQQSTRDATRACISGVCVKWSTYYADLTGPIEARWTYKICSNL